MGWKDNQYFYSVGTLKDIAACYSQEGIEFHRHKIYRYTDLDPWSIAEFKADFDRALDAIGRGHWIGEIMDYKYYRNFSKYQRLIIADICGIPIEGTGINYALRLHGRAYGKLKRFLNKTDEFQFISKPLDRVCV